MRPGRKRSRPAKWLLAIISLAIVFAGGFAMSESEPTLPPFRRILNINFSVTPAELVTPGEVTLTFTITNTSEYTAKNVYIASGDGLHIEPIGQIDPRDSQVINRSHTVTKDELDGGLITFTVSHDGIAGDAETVNYTVQCPIELAIAQPSVEYTRQFTGIYARKGDVVTITYKVRNTGNVQLSTLRANDSLGDYSGRAEALDVGETRIFTNRVVISADSVSSPRLTYTVPTEGNKEYTETLDDAKILLADEQLTATLELDQGAARVGSTVTATLTIMNFGNVDFYDISVMDESFGGIIADGMQIINGSQPLVVQKTYPVRSDADFQFRVRALSQSGATLETLTEPIPFRAIPAGDAEVSIYAEAVFEEIAAGGDVPIDIYIVNAGEGDAQSAQLSETTTETTLKEFAVISNSATTHRRVYVPVHQDAELVFNLEYREASGKRHITSSLPVTIDITRGGHRLEELDEEEPYAGESVKFGRSSLFLAMIICALTVLIGLAIALLLSSRKARRAKRERQALQKRLRQEELGKTNRFTPIKRQDRAKKKENPPRKES